MQQTARSYIAEPPVFPSDVPTGFHVDPSEPKFDPAVHLQVEPPRCLTTVPSFETREFAMPANGLVDKTIDLAYSQPFRVLSDEGVRAFRSILDTNECYAKVQARIPKCLRGLAYRSQFVRDFVYATECVSLMSAMAGKLLTPHGVPMNHCHTNFGRPVTRGDDPLVIDQWHTDSVDYVLVVILSDLTKTDGGDLEVLHKMDARDNTDLIKNGITAKEKHLVHSVRNLAPGYAVFMQGSRIMHRVKPVLFADQARISTVISYMSRDVFDADNTRFETFKEWDPEHVSYVEFARHRAWRVKGIMDWIMREIKFGADHDELANVFRDAAATLQQTERLLTGKETDKLEWIDDKKVQSKL